MAARHAGRGSSAGPNDVTDCGTVGRVTGVEGFACRTCGTWHDGLPFSFQSLAPDYWTDEAAADGQSELGEEQCIIRGELFFVRALIRLPVLDAEEDFEWGVWVSLSESSFLRMSEVWEHEGREREPPAFGWLSSSLPAYEQPTLNLKTTVHTQPVGLRPLVELEPTDHTLAIEQREGIRRCRVQEFAESIVHGA